MDMTHKLNSAARKKALKDYFTQWNGLLFAYDEAFVASDARLAAAIWRTMFDAKPDVEPWRLARIVAYVRKETARVGCVGDRVMANGYVGFGERSDPQEVMGLSPSMDKPFNEGELRYMRGAVERWRKYVHEDREALKRYKEEVENKEEEKNAWSLRSLLGFR